MSIVLPGSKCNLLFDNFIRMYLLYMNRRQRLPMLQHASICKLCPVPVQLAAMSASLMVSCCHLSFICQNAAGVNLLNESNLVAGILLNTMFLLGTFTFAVVLGVVSDDISSEVKVLDHHASHYVQHAVLISGALPIAACCHALGVCIVCHQARLPTAPAGHSSWYILRQVG